MLFLRRIMFFFIAAVISFSLCGAELVLIDNGKSAYSIVIPDGEDPRNRVGEAASVLQNYLEKISGVKLPVVKESAFKGGNAIYLGKTRKAVDAGIPFEKLKEWTYCKKVIGQDLFLAGCDASANIKGNMEHHDREYLGQLRGFNLGETREYREWRGTHKAVTSLLDNEFGVRFLLPGPAGVHVPEKKKITVDAALDFLGSAAFPYCNGRVYGDRTMTIALNHNDVAFGKTYGGHSFPIAVPARIYGKTHPEYFVMVKGERRPEYGPGGAGHLCVSNPEVQELMMKELERQYANGFRWVQLAQTDGLVPCECKECQTLGGGNTGELLWKVYRKIALEMKKRRPDLKLVVLAYHDTANPPTSFDEMPDNVILEMCIWRDYRGFLKKWEKFRNVPKIAYIYFWGAYNGYIFSPCRNLQYLADNLRIMKENNFLSIFKCGWGSAIGLEGPQYYVFSKLLENPGRDPYQIFDEFCNAAYGKAAPVMKQFFLCIDRRLTMPRGGSTLDELETRPRNIEELHLYSFNTGTIRYLDNRLWYASTLDKDPLVQARIKLVQREFFMLKARTRLYTLSNAFSVNRDPAILAAFEKEFLAAEKVIDSWYDKNGKMTLIPGFDWPNFNGTSKNVLMFGGGAVNPSFPREISCGFSLLKASLKMKLSPGDYNFPISQLRSSAAIKRFRKTVDPRTKLAAFGGKELPTLINAGYDKNNLYFHIQANASSDPAAHIKPSGHDGKFDPAESVEIYLDIEGDRKKYYRFAFNPVANSFCEARRGYRDDPLHPDFGKEDLTWNGKWNYTVTYDQKNKKWNAIVTIPLDVLSKDRIAYPGAQWNMNVIRRSVADGKNLTASWVDLPDGSKFDDPETFGKATFAGF